VTAVQITDADPLLDLFARVIKSGMTRLLRRGLDRNYILYEEEGSCIKGKINFGITIKRNLLPYARVNYEYDDLDHNILHNQIIKSVIQQLIQHKKLDNELRKSLILIHRRIHDIDEIRLSERHFAHVRLNRNNAFYGFLLNVCHLIYTNVLAKKGEGDYLFQDFLRDDGQMSRLFQNFVCNFYREELKKVDQTARIIGPETILWYGTSLDEVSGGYLPSMRTDISIKWPDRYLIIDTKFYKQALQRYYDKESIHSNNLYQIFSYLRNFAQQNPEYENCEGMLLYPTVETDLQLHYELHGHRVSICTVDLSKDWRDIHSRLINFVIGPDPGVREFEEGRGRGKRGVA
jgi:5-methylcytosine-specific restriction enzyme subunit McrC